MSSSNKRKGRLKNFQTAFDNTPVKPVMIRLFKLSKGKDKIWATSNQQPATSNQQPATSNQQPIINENYNKINILKLKSLFPEAFCEDQIDWEKLKLILGEENLAHHNERYQLNWAGKSEAYRTLQAPTSNTLIPCQAESVDFDGTNHLFIEAENLEALKILQKAYAGSVKMIYIDPPYNTGSDSFIYPDKFSETREEYARRVGDKDDEGYLKRDGVFQGAWRKNSKESGHYHSNWLSMMLPRLHLAKTLLRDDGVIFISIDDNEQAQLKLLCDEVFGAENFVAGLVWKKKNVVQNDAKFFSTDHEYILCYTKLAEILKLNRLPRTADQEARYQNPDNDPRGAWTSVALQAKSGSSTYQITFPNGVSWQPVSGTFPRLSKESLMKAYEENRLWFGKEGKNVPRLKKYLSEVQDGVLSNTVWLNEIVGSTQSSKENLKKVLGSNVFDTPKPIEFLQRMMRLATDKHSLILDFFSGSGTTAHAVMQLNAEDGGNRRYICVQLPEETDEKSEARKAGFDTIAEIAKERIRRAGRQIREQYPEKTVDTGFKVFKLAESHFKQWRPSENGSDGLEAQLAMFIDPVAEHAEPLNMAYELMLRLGLKPTCSVTHEDDVFWIDDQDTGKHIALLLTRADEALIDAVIAKQPAKAVALDRLFDGNDALKSNTVLQMRDAGIIFECV